MVVLHWWGCFVCTHTHTLSRCGCSLLVGNATVAVVAPQLPYLRSMLLSPPPTAGRMPTTKGWLGRRSGIFQSAPLCLRLVHRWFDSAAGTVSAVLTASSQLPAKQGGALQPYTVRVFTSHLRGAGTDANVCINAVGVSGSSGWKELPAKQSTFEQGQVRAAGQHGVWLCVYAVLHLQSAEQLYLAGLARARHKLLCLDLPMHCRAAPLFTWCVGTGGRIHSHAARCGHSHTPWRTPGRQRSASSLAP